MNVNKNAMSVLKQRPSKVFFEAIPGCIINNAAKECIEYVAKYSCDIILIFNDICLSVSKYDTVDSIVSRYYKRIK